MDQRTIATIALSNRDFASLEKKLKEAVSWIALAAAQGADLAVLPEAINLYCGDGPGNTKQLAYEDVAMDDWQTAALPLIEAARKYRIAVTVPILTREQHPTNNESWITNCFYLVDRDGITAGHYQKMYPTPEEMDWHVRPGPTRPDLIKWDGLQVGGAICFDTCFQEVFDAQAHADLFLIPSLWPGGSQLDYFARRYHAPIVLSYPAWSRIIDLDGRELAAGGYRHETLRFGFGTPIYLATINFDRAVLYGNHNQEKIIDIQRAYGSQISVTFDQPNATFLLESRSRHVSVQEVIKRFDLIEHHIYFDQCRESCNTHRRPKNAGAHQGD